jgi:hypothetical protein
VQPALSKQMTYTLSDHNQPAWFKRDTLISRFNSCGSKSYDRKTKGSVEERGAVHLHLGKSKLDLPAGLQLAYKLLACEQPQ